MTGREQYYPLFHRFKLPYLADITGYTEDYLKKIRHRIMPANATFRAKVVAALSSEGVDAKDLFGKAPEESLWLGGSA